MLANLADLRRLLTLPADASEATVRAALAATPVVTESHEQFMAHRFPHAAAKLGYRAPQPVTARAAGEPEMTWAELVRRAPARTIGY